MQGIHIEERDLLASFRRAEDDRAVALVGRRTGEEDDLREVSTDEVPAARHFVIGLKAECDDQLGQRERLVVIGGRQVVTHARLDVLEPVFELDVVGFDVVALEPAVEVVLFGGRRPDHAGGIQIVVVRTGCQRCAEQRDGKEQIYQILFHTHFGLLFSRVGGQAGGNNVGRKLQGAARIGRTVLVADLIGDLHDGFGVFIEQVAVDRDAEATGVEPPHAFVEELVAAHEDERLKHALLRAALFERVVGGRMELFLGYSIQYCVQHCSR